MLNSKGEHVTKDGKIIPLKNIINSHLVNIIKHIERRAREGLYIVSGYYGVDMMDMDFNVEVIYWEDALRAMNYDSYINELKGENYNVLAIIKNNNNCHTVNGRCLLAHGE